MPDEQDELTRRHSRATNGGRANTLWCGMESRMLSISVRSTEVMSSSATPCTTNLKDRELFHEVSGSGSVKLWQRHMLCL